MLAAAIGTSCTSSVFAAVEGKYLWDRDRDEITVLVPYDPETGETYFFSNRGKPLCFTFKVRGLWKPIRPGGLLTPLDGRRVLVSARPHSPDELGRLEGTDTVLRAATLMAKVLGGVVGAPPKSVKIEPFTTIRGEAFKWSGRWIVERDDQPVEIVTTRILFEFPINSFNPGIFFIHIISCVLPIIYPKLH